LGLETNDVVITSSSSLYVLRTTRFFLSVVEIYRRIGNDLLCLPERAFFLSFKSLVFNDVIIIFIVTSI